MARPPRWQTTLDASRDEACLAVRLYNDPAGDRHFEAFVIHMHLAWLYLLHAEFIRDGVDYRYWDPKRKHRLLKVDGEAKTWDLDRCCQERWGDTSDPVRANLKLFIRMRNKLEHRHSRADMPYAIALAGHAHALLLNYEDELTTQFGQAESLATDLRIPLFIGTFTPQGEQALRHLRKTLPPQVQGFLTEYEAELDPGITGDHRYEFRLRAAIELAPKAKDALSIQFTRYEDMTEDERQVISDMGRRGQVIEKTRKQPVSGLGRLMPGVATKKIQEGVPFKFNQYHFTQAYKKLKVRPPNGAKNPERTNPDWCEYDEPTKSYRYTGAYVQHLIKRCQTEEGFRELTGQTPRPKQP
jgi:hypothetical protein